MSTKTEYAKLGFVMSSDYRVEVMEALDEGPGAPREIADEIDRSIEHVSRALRELRECGAAELLVPEETKKGRIQGLTDTGEELLPMIHDRSQR